jgi:hypothetical protein
MKPHGSLPLSAEHADGPHISHTKPAHNIAIDILVSDLSDMRKVIWEMYHHKEHTL